MKPKTPWNIVNVPKGMTVEKALKECEKHFDVWRWTSSDLDKIVTSDRTTEKAYTVEFKPNVEADEEYKNMSADDLENKGIKGITLLERILLELNYFKETGSHLDIDNITLCSGSRYDDGFVPFVRWYSSDRGLSVGWYSRDGRHSGLRCRVGVILDPSDFNPVPAVPEPLEPIPLPEQLGNWMRDIERRVSELEEK